MTRPPKPDPNSPQDVLAAEEFGIGAGDPGLHHEPVHDVLAAEEFAVGAADAGARRSGGRPGEPPHDVLAAEEFAVPAPPRRVIPPGSAPGARGAGPGDRIRRLALAAGLGVLVARSLRLGRHLFRRR